MTVWTSYPKKGLMDHTANQDVENKLWLNRLDQHLHPRSWICMPTVSQHGSMITFQPWRRWWGMGTVQDWPIHLITMLMSSAQSQSWLIQIPKLFAIRKVQQLVQVSWLEIGLVISMVEFASIMFHLVCLILVSRQDLPTRLEIVRVTDSGHQSVYQSATCNWCQCGMDLWSLQWRCGIHQSLN